MSEARLRLGAAEGVAGCAAGLTGTLIGYPLDRLKARLQSGGGLGSSARALFRGGTASLYRGAGAPLLAQTVLNTVSFSSYAHTRRLVGLPAQTDSSASPAAATSQPGLTLLAGALVALPVTLVSTPAELAKLQQQFQPEYRSGTWHALRTLAARHGLLCLYRGAAVNCVREAVFLATYFAVYEHAKAALREPAWGLPLPLATAAAGGLAGALGWTLSFPLDTLKTAVQGASLAAPREPAALLLRRLVAARGVAGLWAGVGPSVLRAFLVSSTRFSVYELTLDAVTARSGCGER